MSHFRDAANAFFACLADEHRKVQKDIERDRAPSDELRGQLYGESAGISWALGKAKKMLIPAFLADFTQGPAPKWSRFLPHRTGVWWHWSGDVDEGPLPYHVSKGETDGKPFVHPGQYGQGSFINCDDMRGYWLECCLPLVPLTADERKFLVEKAAGDR